MLEKDMFGQPTGNVVPRFDEHTLMLIKVASKILAHKDVTPATALRQARELLREIEGASS